MKRQRDIAQGSDAGAKTDELWQKIATASGCLKK
jgi:hypothetical protein